MFALYNKINEKVKDTSENLSISWTPIESQWKTIENHYKVDEYLGKIIG